MKKILVIEDEKLSADRLIRLVTDVDDSFEVCGPISFVADVVRVLQSDEQFHIIFADVRLKDRLVFEAFHDAPPVAPVIFTTAYDDYALEAFRHNGVDYLLKPIDPTELSAAIAKVSRLAGTPSATPVARLARDLQCFRERFLVAKGEELIPLRVADVRFFRKEDNFVVAHTRQSEVFRLSVSMNDLEEQLDPRLFFRLNRQYITHVESINKIGLFFSSKLIVRLVGCDDDHVVVSKERSALFKQWLDR